MFKDLAKGLEPTKGLTNALNPILSPLVLQKEKPKSAVISYLHWHYVDATMAERIYYALLEDAVVRDIYAGNKKVLGPIVAQCLVSAHSRIHIDYDPKQKERIKGHPSKLKQSFLGDFQ